MVGIDDSRRNVTGGRVVCWYSGTAGGYPRGDPERESNGIDAGLGKMVGTLGELLATMLGSWTSCCGGVIAYLSKRRGGDIDLEIRSKLGLGADSASVGDLSEPDECEAVRFRRLLPWESWW